MAKKPIIKKLISVTLDIELIEKLDERAEIEVRSRSAMANFLLKKALEGDKDV